MSGTFKDHAWTKTNSELISNFASTAKNPPNAYSWTSRTIIAQISAVIDSILVATSNGSSRTWTLLPAQGPGIPHGPKQIQVTNQRGMAPLINAWMLAPPMAWNMVEAIEVFMVLWERLAAILVGLQRSMRQYHQPTSVSQMFDLEGT